MRRRKRMLIALATLLLGLGFYNYTFFRERANRTAVSSTIAPPKATAQMAPTGAESVTTPAAQHAATSAPIANRPPPRSYEEGLVRLSPRALTSGTAIAAAPAARDIFTHRLVATPPTDGTAVQIGDNHGASPASLALESTEKIPTPLRVDGWVRTPEHEYAIVNGSLAKSGTRLPTDERVLTVTRGGVVVSTALGVQVLPLFGEEPNKRLQRNLRSVR